MARPVRYDLVELVEEAPLIVEVKVADKEKQIASCEVLRSLKGVVKGTVLRLEDVPRKVPETTGVQLKKGEHVLLFLRSADSYFAQDQSRVDLRESPKLAGLIEAFLKLLNRSSTAPGASRGPQPFGAEWLMFVFVALGRAECSH